jgi:hypothetical protein
MVDIEYEKRRGILYVSCFRAPAISCIPASHAWKEPVRYHDWPELRWRLWFTEPRNSPGTGFRRGSKTMNLNPS